VAVKKILEPFLPRRSLLLSPMARWRLNTAVRSRWGGCARSMEFWVFIRALAYIFANGPDGLRQTNRRRGAQRQLHPQGLEGV